MRLMILELLILLLVAAFHATLLMIETALIHYTLLVVLTDEATVFRSVLLTLILDIVHFTLLPTPRILEASFLLLILFILL